MSSYVSPDDFAEAEKLKATGNECFRQHKYEEAICQYSAALEIVQVFELKDWPEMPKAKVNALASVLYSNRSQCHLNLNKLHRALNDALSSLGLDPNNGKAAYRKDKALDALKREKRPVILPPEVMVESFRYCTRFDVDVCRMVCSKWNCMIRDKKECLPIYNWAKMDMYVRTMGFDNSVSTTNFEQNIKKQQIVREKLLKAKPMDEYRFNFNRDVYGWKCSDENCFIKRNMDALTPSEEKLIGNSVQFELEFNPKKISLSDYSPNIYVYGPRQSHKCNEFHEFLHRLALCTSVYWHELNFAAEFPITILRLIRNAAHKTRIRCGQLGLVEQGPEHPAYGPSRAGDRVGYFNFMRDHVRAQDFYHCYPTGTIKSSDFAKFYDYILDGNGSIETFHFLNVSIDTYAIFAKEYLKRVLNMQKLDSVVPNIVAKFSSTVSKLDFRTLCDNAKFIGSRESVGETPSEFFVDRTPPLQIDYIYHFSNAQTNNTIEMTVVCPRDQAKVKPKQRKISQIQFSILQG